MCVNCSRDFEKYSDFCQNVSEPSSEVTDQGEDPENTLDNTVRLYTLDLSQSLPLAARFPGPVFLNLLSSLYKV
jgi:hypothetical protein